MPRDTSPTPSERERLDAEARQREQEEQSKLPYKWTQSISDLDITVPLPVGIKAKELDVKIAKQHLYVSVKNESPIIEVRVSPILHCLHANIEAPGRSPSRNPCRRVLVDPRNESPRQRTIHPPRQGQQNGVVGTRRDERTKNRHEQDSARELEAERSRW